MVPCRGWKGLRDKAEGSLIVGIGELITLLSDCSKQNGLLQQDVRDYNAKESVRK
jgi:hypothetical protein